MSAQSRLESVRRRIERKGQPLTVTRRPATQGGAVTTQTIYFLPQSQAIGDDSPVTMDGDLSGNQLDPSIFICAGDADVREAVDTIAYLGIKYRIASVGGPAESGVTIVKHCTGIRTGT